MAKKIAEPKDRGRRGRRLAQRRVKRSRMTHSQVSGSRMRRSKSSRTPDEKAARGWRAVFEKETPAATILRGDNERGLVLPAGRGRWCRERRGRHDGRRLADHHFVGYSNADEQRTGSLTVNESSIISAGSRYSTKSAGNSSTASKRMNGSLTTREHTMVMKMRDEPTAEEPTERLPFLGTRSSVAGVEYGYSNEDGSLNQRLAHDKSNVPCRRRRRDEYAGDDTR